jgi:hypothetical protein
MKMRRSKLINAARAKGLRIIKPSERSETVIIESNNLSIMVPESGPLYRADIDLSLTLPMAVNAAYKALKL